MNNDMVNNLDKLGHPMACSKNPLGENIAVLISLCYIWLQICLGAFTTSSTAQGGGGSFKNRKPIGEIGCCESGMAERIH